MEFSVQEELFATSQEKRPEVDGVAQAGPGAPTGQKLPGKRQIVANEPILDRNGVRIV